MGETRDNKPDVFVIADNVLSPLGKTTAKNFSNLKQGVSGVKQHHNQALSAVPVVASLFDEDETFYADGTQQYTRFERLLIASIEQTLFDSGINAEDEQTVLIISSTKGNIALLATGEHTAALNARISLSTSAKLIAAHFGFKNQPVVVSNACISGVLAVITGMRLLRSGQYENAVIAGADVISKFIVSGFESFRALSAQVCKPFDAARNGLNLGEGAGTVILSTNPKYRQNIKVLGGSVSNDANHISGPSRTGEELGDAIKKALKDAGKQAPDIDFISAHGTATVYNDEMEANAITLAGLKNTPLTSLKGNYGHTLGAAGLIESIMAIQSIQQGLILPTLGFENNGVSNAINVCTSVKPVQASSFIKTASGFGGCNAAIIFGK